MSEDQAEAPFAARRRRVQLSIYVIIAACVIALIGNIGITLFTDVWQLDGVIVMLLCLIGSYWRLVLPRVRAGELAAAVRLAHRILLVIVVLCCLLMAGTALALALTAFIMTLAIAPGVLSFHEVNRLMLTTTIVVIGLMAADVLGSPFQAQFPLFQLWLYIMSTAATAGLFVLILRDFRQYPLTTKLQVSFLFVSLGGVGLHAYLGGLNLRNELTEETDVRLEQAADAGARLVRASLDDALALAASDAGSVAVAAALAAVGPERGERAAAALAALRQRELRPASGAALIGPDGAVLATSGPISVDVAALPAGARADLREDAIEVDAPLGSPPALLRVRYPGDALRVNLDHVAAMAGAGVHLLVVGPDDAPRLRAGAGADGPAGAANFVEKRRPLVGGDLRVAARMDLAALLAPLESRDRYAKLVGILVAMLVTVVAFGVGGVLSRPVVGLTDAVVRMRGGDLSARATIASSDELGELTRAFNAMATQLGELFAGLSSRTAELQVEVTTRKEREQQLHRLNEELSSARDRALEASRVKSTFLANMSHELRTPLNAIIGYTELLREDAAAAGESEAGRDLAKIHGAANHLLAIITDILDLSKIEAGKMDVHIEPVGFRELVAEVTMALTPLARKNGDVFLTEVGPEIGDIHTDRTKLRQILYNLLSNATKFTERGQIRLSAARTVDPATGTDALRFTVADSGIGIAAEKLAGLFEPFMQADDSTTRRFGGTGLGLAITRRFCRMLGGDIEVDSAPAQGARFTVTIPVHRPTPARVEPVADWAELPQRLPADARATTVLVVDDEMVVHELMGRFLAREGYRVLSARTGAEALRLARQAQPDVITLDVLMPGMDGWAVLSALKNDPQLARVPVVVMSIVSDRDLGFSLGAADYLLKPIDRERLIATLGRYRKPDAAASVLVVDDEADIRELLCRLAERAQWSVRAAANGREAIEALRVAIPDVVLLDLMMPEVDGFGVLQAMRAEPSWRGVPVIVITARELSRDELEFLQAGVHRILRKGSYSKAALLAEVRTLVEATAAATAAPDA